MTQELLKTLIPSKEVSGTSQKISPKSSKGAGDDTGGLLQPSDLRTYYAGVEETLHGKIKSLEKSPAGHEAEIADLTKQRQANMDRILKFGKEGTPTPEAKQPKGIDPLQRGLIRLFNSREYKGGFPSQQRQLRVDAYDKYVVPYFRRKGIDPPDRDYFIDRVSPVEQPLSEALFGGAVEAAKSMTKMDRALYLGYQTLITRGTFAQTKQDYGYKYLSDIINKEDAYLAENYADDTRAQAIKYVGREAPSWVLWGLAGGAEAKVGTAIGKTALNAYGKFALKRVAEFASGFLGSKLQEEDNKEAAINGGIFAGLGTAHFFLGKMAGWLGLKGATQQISKDAETLTKGQKVLGEGRVTPAPPSSLPPPSQLGPGTALQPPLPPQPVRVGEATIDPIITPPPTEIIPPTPELGTGGRAGARQLPPARSIQVPGSNLPPQGLLKSGVEGAKRPLDFISQANFRILNQATREVSNGKYKAFAMAPDTVRMDALKKVGYALGKAANDAAETNPELIEHKATANIAQQAAKSPAFKQMIDITAEPMAIPPANPAAANIKRAAANVATHVTEMSKQEKVWSRISELMKGIGPGAASKNEAAVIDNITNMIRSNFKLQGKINQIAFAWSVRDALPEDVKSVVAEEMKKIFGNNPKKWDKAASILEKHIDSLIKTGKITPVDMRGVFRSTDLTGNPTQWQEQLTQEVKELTKQMRQNAKKYKP